MTLTTLGWDDSFADSFRLSAAAGLVPARVAIQHKQAYEVLSVHGGLAAECTGRLLHAARAAADLPAVGDWVAVYPRSGEARADIHAVLPRRTKFSRCSAGETAAEQVVAANVDTVLLVTALDQNFNLRRIERYLAVAWASGAQPVVILNKADLHADPAAARAEVAALAGGAPVVALSALGANATEDHSLVRHALAPWLVPGHTLALLGSSGVGKSTLINRLVDVDRQRTQTLSDAVGKGRHTTTQRELIMTPSGALVIDTPGMRELQLWDVAAEALGATFADIEALAARCRFRDCSHGGEPGCAVQAARDDGSLPPDRWQGFRKLQREQAYASRRADPRLDRENRAAWKKIHRQHRALTRMQEHDE